MSVINSIEIFEKGNECSRLTVTKNNDVRTKFRIDLQLHTMLEK